MTTSRGLDFLPNDWRSAAPGTVSAALARHWLGIESAGISGHAQAMQMDLLADVASLEEQVRHSYTGRYVMELLQNAHDACVDNSRTGTASVIVTNSALLVADDGIGFTPERIAALTRVGSSEKADRPERHTIGYKGIGFTAVFEASDRPQIIGRDTRFQFDTARLHEVFMSTAQAQRIPVRYFPFPLLDVEWAEDAGVVAALFKSGSTTVVRLPHRSEITVDQVRDAVRESVRPELLLFMPGLGGIRVDIGDSARTWIRSEGRRRGTGRIVQVADTVESHRWLVARGTVPLGQEQAKALNDSLWGEVRSLNVAVALPWRRGRPAPSPSGSQLFAYFPTEDSLGRSILVHGDFYLDPSRRHIEGAGSAGKVSVAVAAEAARLTGILARENASAGADLLEALAPISSPTGFGRIVGQYVDAALTEEKFVLAGKGEFARRPKDLRQAAYKLTTEEERLFTAILSPAGDLIHPDGAPRQLRSWLEELGVSELPPSVAAQRLTLRRLPTGLSYTAALRLLSRWVGALDWGERALVISRLKGRPIIRATSGSWTTPKTVVMHSDAPALPTAIRRREASLPRDEGARQFLLNTIGVDLLSAEKALDYLIQAIKLRPGFPATDVDREESLAFIKALWAQNRTVLERPGVGVIPVPTRTSGQRKRHWRPAQDTYFSHSWSPSSTVEDLYGRLGASEFLADAQPADHADRRSIFALYQQLGVTDKPRMLALANAQPDEARWREWMSLPDVASAYNCDDGHTGSRREPEGSAMDRLDQVLEVPEAILIDALLALPDPFGEPTYVKCAHSSHSSRSGRKRAGVGYQEWRLAEAAWVPVTGDPTGRAKRRPRESWTQLPLSRRFLLLPRAAVRPKDAVRLGLIAAESAPPAAIERALLDLFDSFPDLDRAPPQAEQTARWLMNRLDRVTERGQVTTSQTSPPLPALVQATVAWATDPLIADLPGLGATDLALLPPGRWTGLRRAYGLKRMSEVVDARVDASEKRGEPLLLPARRRAELLAFLSPVVADSTRTAGGLATVREVAASRLTITWRLAEDQAANTSHPAIWLSVQRDQRGARIGATLYRLISASVDFVALGGMLAEYIDELPRDMDIAQFLSDPVRLLEYRGVTEDDVQDAMRTLAGRRRFVADPAGGVENSRQTEVPSPDGLQHSSTLQSATEPPLASSGYIDPVATHFGTGQQVGARDVEPRPRAWRAPEPGDLELTGGMVPPGPSPRGAIRRDERAEKIAVELVRRYAVTKLGATSVIDRQADNVGWDLEFLFADGRRMPVEVKGSAGDAPFRLTPNERTAAESTPDYALYFVTGTARAANERMLIRIDNFGSQLTDGRLQVTDWVVTGWEAMAHTAVPLEAT